MDRETIADERDPAITTETIRLHRLVREVAAGRCVGEAREEARRAWIEVMAAVYPRDVFSNPATWPRARRLDALALGLVGRRCAAAERRGSARLAILLNSLGQYRQSALAAYPEARPLFERALAIREKALGPEHPDTATSLNNLALLLQAQGDLAGARPLFERALAICEKALGPEHPAHRDEPQQPRRPASGPGRPRGRAAAVSSARWRSREKALGPEHPDTATSLNDLAALLQAQGDLAGARPLYERALAIREKALGPEHPDTATSLNNLALLLQAQGDLAGARPLYERALAICEKALGPEHPETATSLNNLAVLLQAQGDLAGARPLFERALAIREKALGPEHPETATSLNNLAMLLQAQGDSRAARPLLERALAIGEKTLGPDHSDVATGISNLAPCAARRRRIRRRRAAVSAGDRHRRERRSAATIRSRSAMRATTLACSATPADAPEALPLAEAALAAHEREFRPEPPLDPGLRPRDRRRARRPRPRRRSGGGAGAVWARRRGVTLLPLFAGEGGAKRRMRGGRAERDGSVRLARALGCSARFGPALSAERGGVPRSRLAPLDLPSSVGFADIFSRKREKGTRRAAISTPSAASTGRSGASALRARRGRERLLPLLAESGSYFDMAGFGETISEMISRGYP